MRLPRALFEGLEAKGMRLKLLVCTTEPERLRCLSRLLPHLAWLPPVVFVNPFEAEERGISMETLPEEVYREMASSAIRVVDFLKRTGYVPSQHGTSSMDCNLLRGDLLTTEDPPGTLPRPPSVLTLFDAGIDELWHPDRLEIHAASLSCLGIEGMALAHRFARFDGASGSFFLKEGPEKTPAEPIPFPHLLKVAQESSAVIILNSVVEPLMLLTGLPILSVSVSHAAERGIRALQEREIKESLERGEVLWPARQDLFVHALLREAPAHETSPENVLLGLISLLRRRHAVNVDTRQLARRDERVRKVLMPALGSLIPAHL